MLHVIGYPARAENIPPILLRSLLQRAVSANGKKGNKTAKAELAGINCLLHQPEAAPCYSGLSKAF